MRVVASRLLLCGLLACGGCAVQPPSAPGVVVMPPAGKDLAQFQREDASCRGIALQQLASVPADARQRQSDIVYAQCMAANGNQVQSFTAGWASPPDTRYWSFYDPWYGPGASVLFLGRSHHQFDHGHFDHDHFAHDHFAHDHFAHDHFAHGGFGHHGFPHASHHS